MAHLCNRRERDWVLGEFKAGNSPILIATDVASRGLGMFFIYKQALWPLAECHKSRRASPSFWFTCLVMPSDHGRRSLWCILILQVFGIVSGERQAKQNVCVLRRRRTSWIVPIAPSDLCPHAAQLCSSVRPCRDWAALYL